MSKWKCEICGNEFENFHAQGFDNKIYCPLCYFKKENQKLERIQKEKMNCIRVLLDGKYCEEIIGVENENNMGNTK